MKPMTDPMSAPAWPPTTYALPDLWTRAKALFVVLMREVKSVAGLARTRHLTYRQRTDILCRLVPIEKIVRSLLMTEALIFLLMTPQGRRMLATTPKKPPPSPPPVGVKKNTHKITIPMPGWNTIAALQPRIDPRIDAPEAAAHDDPRTPENMACRFRVLAWAHATPEHPPCKEPPRRSWVTTFEPSNFPASEHPASKSPAGANVDSESSPPWSACSPIANLPSAAWRSSSPACRVTRSCRQAPTRSTQDGGGMAAPNSSTRKIAAAPPCVPSTSWKNPDSNPAPQSAQPAATCGAANARPHPATPSPSGTCTTLGCQSRKPDA